MRIRLTIAIGVFMLVLLGWQHVHGGIPAHHLLARKDLPAISNAWGLLTLPALAWFLLGRMDMRRRAARATTGGLAAGLAGALLYGALLALCFVSGRPDVSNAMAMAVFPISLFYPVYRAECVLGFVLGMTFFLGAILPAIAALVFAGIGALLYHGVRFVGRRMAALVR